MPRSNRLLFNTPQLITEPTITNSNLTGHLSIVVVGNALMRIGSGASGVLVGLYLANLANHGFPVSTALVGTLGAVAFVTELFASVPMGLASDALAPRALMTVGAIIGAAATQLFGVSGRTSIFFVSRAVEGFGAAAVTPSLLSYLTDVTHEEYSLRAKVMSYFELSLLAGLALGGLLGAELWRSLNTIAFSAVAAIYVLSAGFLFVGAVGSRGYGNAKAISGFFTALKEPSLRRLAPIWLCVNTIVGLWLGPTLPFLLTHKGNGKQFLDGIFWSQPELVGWMLLTYSLIFGMGVTAWSFVLPHMAEARAMRIALVAMVGVCVGLFLLNHSGAESLSTRWVIGVLTVSCIMVESGFTPAALSLLAGAIGAQPGRGAAMGIYSVLLSVGAVVGSLLAAAMGQAFAINGLIYSTLVMALLALVFVRWLRRPKESLNVELPV